MKNKMGILLTKERR